MPKPKSAGGTSVKIGESLFALLCNDKTWKPYIYSLASGTSSLHLAILRGPYLDYILSGKKSIESRFSKNGCIPYGRVSEGDVILLKRAGGPIRGICNVSGVWNYRLDSKSWKEIRRDFLRAMFITDPSFLHDRRNASFATLMRLQDVRPIGPLSYTKRDRRGWVILRHRRENGDLEEFLTARNETSR